MFYGDKLTKDHEIVKEFTIKFIWNEQLYANSDVPQDITTVP